MFFLNPSFLWALLGLSVPVAIHLWSKKQGRNIKVGSIKFLQTSNSRKSRSIKLNEMLLLLLRMLLITILVFILSEPRWNYTTENSPITYLVEASLLDSPEVKTLVDSLDAQAEVRFLQADFPEYNSELSGNNILSKPLNYWQLAREMQNLKTDSIVVFTNAFLIGIKGKKPEINKNINWINLNSGQTESNRVGVIKNGDEEELILAISDADVFRFQKEIQKITPEIRDSILVIEKDTLQVNMFSEDKFSAESRYLKASFSALAKFLNHPIDIKSIENEADLKLSSSDVLVWLSEESAPKTEGIILKFRKDFLSNSLIEQGNSENEFYLTAGLNSENIVEKQLGEQLFKLLNLYPELEKEAVKYDRRVMNPEFMKTNFKESSKSNSKQEGRDFSKYSWLVFGILLISERILSKSRKQ